MGDYVRAQEMLEEAPIWRDHTDLFWRPVALDYLCTHYWRLGHFEQAKGCWKKASILYRQLGDVWDWPMR
jgi:tetratricopeptide (TPR) repeat protein